MAQLDKKEGKGKSLKGKRLLGKASTKHQRGGEDREERGEKGKGGSQESSKSETVLD